MARTMQISDSIVIAVDPATAYDNIADVTRMGRWSPENTGAVVADPDRPPRVGDTFVGANTRGAMRWHTGCVVTAAERGSRFAFQVQRWGLRKPALRVAVASWEYRFEPVDGGTRVTETWIDDRTGWPDPVAAVFDRIVTGKRGFAEFQEGNIRRTLARLKEALESEQVD
ncbi:SRPBCC family protein [Nocardia harenae]|uniref:SRPBCC family protein n=1 Tax=Nocardia harenae TaxID=358707 RepID=UPI0008328276|nr:SRPBCC family protein [Nocardia harenae]